jgi:hypothetical protein
MTVLAGARRNVADTVDAANDISPLMGVVMRHFTLLHAHRRGTIAVPRIVIAAAAQPDACVAMLNAVTAAMPDMVFHSHAHYAVTYILRRLPEILPLPVGAVAAPLRGAECTGGVSGTPALPYRSDRAASKRNGAGPRTAFSTAELLAHRDFVAMLTEVLSADIARACEQKCASHVLEVALTRNDFAALPDVTLPLFEALVPTDRDAVELRGVFERPDAVHVVRALLTVLTAPAADVWPTQGARATRARVARGVLVVAETATLCRDAGCAVQAAKAALIALTHQATMTEYAVAATA